MHDVLVSALSVEHVFPVRNHARKKSSEKKKMTVQGSSDGQAFVRNAVTKITVFFVSKS